MNIFSKKLFDLIIPKAAYIIAIIFIFIYCIITIKKTNNIGSYKTEEVASPQQQITYNNDSLPEHDTPKSQPAITQNNIDISNNAAIKSLNYLERQVLNLVVASSKIDDNNKSLNSLTNNNNKLNLAYLYRLQDLITNNILTKQGTGKNAYCGADVEVKINDEKKLYRLYSNQDIPEYLLLLLLTMKEGDTRLIETIDKSYSVDFIKILPHKNDDVVKQNIVFYGSKKFAYCGNKGKIVYSIYNLDGSVLDPNLMNLTLNIENDCKKYPVSLINVIAGKAVNSETEIIIDAKNRDEKYYKYIPVKKHLSQSQLFLIKASLIQLESN